ncbi:MAG: universal stress protein [Deltaproteobacteria bacterium]|nr:universal stress protein [Deltaproteobacteria bacterium]
MKKIMLVLSTSGTSDAAINYAVARAKKESAGIVALYILETGLANEVFEKFSDIGFIGDKPSTDLSESIMKEYRQRGYEELGRVQIKAMEEGVDYEPLMEQGDFVTKVLTFIKGLDVKAAVLVKRKRRNFFNYFSKSLADEVKSQAGCEVVIFDEE